MPSPENGETSAPSELATPAKAAPDPLNDTAQSPTTRAELQLPGPPRRVDPPTVRIWKNEVAQRVYDPPPPPPDWQANSADEAATPKPSIAGYEVLELLGTGGMGVVFKARQLLLNRYVALKMVQSSELSDRESFGRFRAEAEAIARLQHPHIVQIYEVGECEGRPFFSMEYVGGGTLAQKLNGTAQAPEQSAAMVETLARTVQYAHEHGVVHRDLKPGNVLLLPGKPPSTVVKAIEPITRSEAESSLKRSPTALTPTPGTPTLGQPKITDFGLAKYVPGFEGHTGHSSISRPGLIVGTPQYMAPEQATGAVEEVGPAADIYSLGAILYEMLTGQPPFQGTNAMDTLLQVRFLDPIPPRYWQPNVPRDLETICLKCLHKEPRKRYDSAAALGEDLFRYRSGQPIHARPISWGERLWKVTQRFPIASGVAVLASIALLLGCGSLALEWQTAVTQSQALARTADGLQRELASARAAAAQQEQQLYLSHVQQAAAGPPQQVAALLLRNAPALRGRDLRQFEWHYLHRLARSAIAQFDGPDEGIEQLLLAGDGQRLTAWAHAPAAPTELWQWSWPNGARLPPVLLAGHHATAMAAHPREAWLAVGCDDGSLAICQRAPDAPIELRGQLPEAIRCLAMSPDGTAIFAGTAHGLYGVECAAGPLPPQPVWHGDGRLFAVVRGGTHLAVADGKALHLVPSAGPSPVRTLSLPERITAVTGSRDGERIAVGCADGSIRILAFATGLELHYYRAHAGPVSALALLPNDRDVASGGADGSICYWNAERREPLPLAGHAGAVTTVLATRDPRRTLTAGMDGAILHWDFTVDPRVRSISAFEAPAHPALAGYAPPPPAIQVEPEGALWKFVDPATGKILARLACEGRACAIALSPDRRWLAVGDGNRVRLCELGKEHAPREYHHAGGVGSLAFDARSARLAVGCQRGGQMAILPKTADGFGTVLRFVGPRAGSAQLLFSPDGSQLATLGERDSSLRLYQAATGDPIAQCDAGTSIAAFAYSPDGQRLATVGESPSALLWDAPTGQLLLRLPLPTGSRATQIQFAPDGQRLIAPLAEGEFAVWEGAR